MLNAKKESLRQAKGASSPGVKQDGPTKAKEMLTDCTKHDSVQMKGISSESAKHDTGKIKEILPHTKHGSVQMKGSERFDTAKLKEMLSQSAKHDCAQTKGVSSSAGEKFDTAKLKEMLSHKPKQDCTQTVGEKFDTAKIKDILLRSAKHETKDIIADGEKHDTANIKEMLLCSTKHDDALAKCILADGEKLDTAKIKELLLRSTKHGGTKKKGVSSPLEEKQDGTKAKGIVDGAKNEGAQTKYFLGNITEHDIAKTKEMLLHSKKHGGAKTFKGTSDGEKHESTQSSSLPSDNTKRDSAYTKGISSDVTKHVGAQPKGILSAKSGKTDNDGAKTTPSSFETKVVNNLFETNSSCTTSCVATLASKNEKVTLPAKSLKRQHEAQSSTSAPHEHEATRQEIKCGQAPQLDDLEFYGSKLRMPTSRGCMYSTFSKFVKVNGDKSGTYISSVLSYYMS